VLQPNANKLNLPQGVNLASYQVYREKYHPRCILKKGRKWKGRIWQVGVGDWWGSRGPPFLALFLTEAGQRKWRKHQAEWAERWRICGVNNHCVYYCSCVGNIDIAQGVLAHEGITRPFIFGRGHVWVSRIVKCDNNKWVPECFMYVCRLEEASSRVSGVNNHRVYYCSCVGNVDIAQGVRAHEGITRPFIFGRGHVWVSRIVKCDNDKWVPECFMYVCRPEEASSRVSGVNNHHVYYCSYIGNILNIVQGVHVHEFEGMTRLFIFGRGHAWVSHICIVKTVKCDNDKL